MREQKALDEGRTASRGDGAGGGEAGSRAAGTGAPGEVGYEDGGATDRDGEPSSTSADPDSGDPGESVGDEDEAARRADRVPEDVGDGRDDDVVARQLREAAMNEEDPVLREKLWEEYREYKRSVGR